MRRKRIMHPSLHFRFRRPLLPCHCSSHWEQLSESLELNWKLVAGSWELGTENWELSASKLPTANCSCHSIKFKRQSGIGPIICDRTGPKTETEKNQENCAKNKRKIEKKMEKRQGGWIKEPRKERKEASWRAFVSANPLFQPNDGLEAGEEGQ